MQSWIFETINAHRQKYLNSCSPSLAEMLLKLEKAVDPDYYDEQDRDQNQNVGLQNIKDKTISGITFRSFQPGGGTLKDKIDYELGAGRFLGVYLPDQMGFHGFVIAGKVNDEYVLLTKHSELGGGEGKFTIHMGLFTSFVPQLEGKRDVIYYER